jgi:hypothetical protein
VSPDNSFMTGQILYADGGAEAILRWSPPRAASRSQCHAPVGTHQHHLRQQ